MDRLAKGEWDKPVELPEVDPSTWTMDPSQCSTTNTLRTKDPVSEWADANPGRFPARDLRDDPSGHMNSIINFLRAQRAPRG